MTRYMVIWDPTFETGRSRHELVESLHLGWKARAPQLIGRRKIELVDTADPEVRRHCDEWMERHWGRHLRHTLKTLSVVAVSDPEWEKDVQMHQKSVQAMNAGHGSGGGRPKICVFALEMEKLQ